MTGAGERLAELRREREDGMRQLRLLDARRSEVRDTLLRIDGAIQVLAELAAEDDGAVVDAAGAVG